MIDDAPEAAHLEAAVAIATGAALADPNDAIQIRAAWREVSPRTFSGGESYRRVLRGTSWVWVASLALRATTTRLSECVEERGCVFPGEIVAELSRDIIRGAVGRVRLDRFSIVVRPEKWSARRTSSCCARRLVRFRVDPGRVGVHAVAHTKRHDGTYRLTLPGGVTLDVPSPDESVMGEGRSRYD